MIEAYFAQLESILRDFPNIQSYSLTKKIYNLKQGYMSGAIVFENGCRLDFVEVKDTELAGKIKYRYQYMDAKQELVFRYDNAPHHKDGEAFPHHKHTLTEVQGSREPSLHDILLEIAQLERVGIRDQVRRKLTPGE
jgi:hypothetical protein